MSMERSPTPPHSIDLEVSGQELPLLRQILNGIQLTDDVCRVRIEIESESPIHTGDLLNNEKTESDDQDEDGVESPEEPEADETSHEAPERPDTETTWEKIPLLKCGGGAYHVLSELVDRDQFLTTEQIKQFVPNSAGVDDSHIPSIISVVRDWGLIEQRNHPDDSRKRQLKATGKGADAITKSNWLAEEIKEDQDRTVIEEVVDQRHEAAEEEEEPDNESAESDAESEAIDVTDPDYEDSLDRALGNAENGETVVSDDPDHNQDDESDEQSHLTDTLVSDEMVADEEEDDDEFDPEVLLHDDASESVEEIDLPLNQNTQRYRIMAVLWRAEGWLSSGDIADMLDGTEWETAAGAISATFSPIFKVGAVCRIKNPDDSRGYSYQLTEVGEEWVEQTFAETPGYSIRVADQATSDDETEAKAGV